MSKYVEVSINVSEGQVKKIKDAMESGEGVTIRLSAADLGGSHVFHVTKTQAEKISQCREENKGMDLKMSKTQVKANVKLGGFLGAILPFLATAARTILPPLIGGLAFSGGAKVVDAIDRKVQGQGIGEKYVRHGAEIKKVVYLKKGDKAMKFSKLGSGVYMSAWKKGNGIEGNGLYMKGPMGYGLISGTPQVSGPIDKIPLLGSLLGWLI